MTVRKPNKLNLRQLCLLVSSGLVGFYGLVYRPHKTSLFHKAYMDELGTNVISVDIIASINDELRETILQDAKTLIDIKYHGWNGILKKADQACAQGLNKYTNTLYEKYDDLNYFRSDYVTKLSYAIEESLIESVYISNYCQKLFGVIR